MRKRFRSHPLSEEESEPLINLTPLIDVVFVVLITFMLIAPILDVDSIDLANSGGVERKEGPPTSISITIRSDNSIWYQGSKVSLLQLENILKSEKKQSPNAIPQLVQDQEGRFGTYQSVKNILELVGFEQMDVVLKPG